MLPTREIYWNVEHHTLLYAVFAVALAVFLYGMYRRVRLWSAGQKEDPFGEFFDRLKFVSWAVIRQRKILRERTPGIIHLFIFYGFAALFIGTCLVALQIHLGWKILYGDFYLYYSLALDVSGLLFMAGVLLAVHRRYLSDEDSLKPENRREDVVILGLLLVILITGFLVEGARIAATQPAWAGYSPVGYAYSILIMAVFSEGSETDTLERLRTIHCALWWIHMILAMAFIAYIPYSKLLHIFTAPLNVLLHSTLPDGALRPLDLENLDAKADAETAADETRVFGVLRPEDFTWKQLLDVDACMRCGRCDSKCPATLAEKPLRPQKIILDIRSQMEEDVSGRLPGGKISNEEIWACTTCRACVRHCPVNIEHLQKIIDLRRGPGLMEGKYPAEVIRTMKNISSQKNPYGLGREQREDWMEGLDIKRLPDTNTDNDNKEPVTLFWVGCAGAFDDRNRRVTRAFAKILKKLKTDFYVLGNEEPCCGDPLRRFGDEMGYQQLVKQNIELLKKYKVKDIVTCCPHCFNTLKNEYPQFGGDFNVQHHVEFIAEHADLIKDSLNLSLNLNKEVVSGLAGKTVTYHDPCYLGRHNIIYNEPREILGLVPGIETKEMELRMCRSFCCGGGGGHMWMEQKVGRNINEMRTDQALDTGADVIATACPYCLTMLSNGLKTKNREDVKVMDIAEIWSPVRGAPYL